MFFPLQLLRTLERLPRRANADDGAVCLSAVQAADDALSASAARAAASLSSRMNVFGRAARRNFAHGCGMPLFRHCETDPGVMPQRLATFPVPPSASMIVLASMFAIIGLARCVRKDYLRSQKNACILFFSALKSSHRSTEHRAAIRWANRQRPDLDGEQEDSALPAR